MSVFEQVLYYVTISYQLLALVSAGVLGILFFFKRSGQLVANKLYGLLLLVAAGMQLHFVFASSSLQQLNPIWPYLPIYFSLSLPVLFFYYVKLNLFPSYSIRASDLKHGILPIGQLLYIWAIFLDASWRIPGGRYFYNPFYGGFEQALFILLFPMYIVFGYQYFRYCRRQLGTSLPRRLWYIHKLLKGTMLFVMAYAILGVSDFVMYKFFHLDLKSYPLFAATSVASFSSLVLFFVVYGFQVLLWGRRLLAS